MTPITSKTSASRMSRRRFLRASGVALGLPFLHSMMPRAMATAPTAAVTGDVRRFVGICSPLGFHTPYLFPETAGPDYEVTPYLQPLQGHRDHFSVISGMMHPDVDGGHSAEHSFLTGAAHPGAPSFRNSISIDQYAAESIGHLTRYPGLVLSANYNTSLSYTRSGVRVPAESRPSRVFQRLFMEGTEAEKEAQMRRIKDGQSIMDMVLDQTKQISRRVGRDDHEALDQYFTSVREFEQRLVAAEQWEHRPKPQIDEQPPDDIEDRADFTGRMRLMYDLIFLALRTDSTRLISFCGAGGNEVVSLEGVDDGWHNLSHHSRDPEKIEKLAIIELEEMRLFAEFLDKLASVREGGHTLLDQTAIVLGSNLGNASSHTNTDLPIIAAGGRFRHGQYHAYDPERPPPLSNLFVSCLQHLGLEKERFSSGTGALDAIMG